MPIINELLPFVQPVGSLGLGMAASVIAYVQWKTARTKLRLDLYDRRINALSDIRSAIDRIMSNQFDPDHFYMARRSVMKARSLFGNDVCVHLDQLAEAMQTSLETTLSMQAGQSDPENNSRELRGELARAVKLINAKARNVTDTADPYLKIILRN